jgi:hypothetical protein
VFREGELAPLAIDQPPQQVLGGPLAQHCYRWQSLRGFASG